MEREGISGAEDESGVGTITGRLASDDVVVRRIAVEEVHVEGGLVVEAREVRIARGEVDHGPLGDPATRRAATRQYPGLRAQPVA